MADGPWAKFQEPSAEVGPWAKFGADSDLPDTTKQAQAVIRRPIESHEESTFVPTHSFGGGGMTVTGKPEEVEQVRGAKRNVAVTGAASAATAGLSGMGGILGWIARGLASGGVAGATHALSKTSETGSPDLPGAKSTALGFSAAEMGGEAVGKGVSKVAGSKFVKDLMKSKVAQLEEEHAAKTAQAKAAYEEQVQAHKQKIKQVEQEHKQQLAEMEAEHTRNVEAHKQQIQATAQMEEQKAAQTEAEYQKELTAHKEKVAEVNADYQKKAQKFKDAESIKAQQKELGTTVGENVKLADKTISKKLGDEFQSVNEAVEKKGPTAQPTDATKSARAEILFPDSLQAFNTIIKNLGENVKGGEFSNMRASYTKLNELIYGGGELPPDLLKAVKIVRNSLGKDLQKAAESVGMGERYGTAMRKWAEYMDDWHDATAIAKGGSPISRLLSAEDPAFVVDQFGGKASERLIKTLEKYKQYGVNTDLAKNLKDATTRLKSMSVPKEAPEAPKLPAAPERKPGETFTRIPTPPQAPAPPSSVGIPTPPQEPITQPFDRKAAERKYLIDLIRKALLVGGGGAASAYGFEKLFGGKSSGPIP